MVSLQVNVEVILHHNVEISLRYMLEVSLHRNIVVSLCGQFLVNFTALMVSTEMFIENLKINLKHHLKFGTIIQTYLKIVMRVVLKKTKVNRVLHGPSKLPYKLTSTLSWKFPSKKREFQKKKILLFSQRALKKKHYSILFEFHFCPMPPYTL